MSLVWLVVTLLAVSVVQSAVLNDAISEMVLKNREKRQTRIEPYHNPDIPETGIRGTHTSNRNQVGGHLGTNPAGASWGVHGSRSFNNGGGSVGGFYNESPGERSRGLDLRLGQTSLSHSRTSHRNFGFQSRRTGISQGFNGGSAGVHYERSPYHTNRGANVQLGDTMLSGYQERAAWGNSRGAELSRSWNLGGGSASAGVNVNRSPGGRTNHGVGFTWRRRF